MDEELERIKMRKLAEMMTRGTAGQAGPAEPVVLSDMDFDKFVSSYPVVLVVFWAEWWAPAELSGRSSNSLLMFTRDAWLLAN